MKGPLSLFIFVASTCAVSLPSFPPLFNTTNVSRPVPTPPALNATGFPGSGGIPPFRPAEVESHLKPRQSSSCENSATSRDCWGDYSIDTNYYVRYSSAHLIVLSFPKLCMAVKDAFSLIAWPRP